MPSQPARNRVRSANHDHAGDLANMTMKVPISDNAVIDLDAPVLSSFEARIKGTVRWVVWCKHCQVWHRHVPGEGHREAHCNDSVSHPQGRSCCIRIAQLATTE